MKPHIMLRALVAAGLLCFCQIALAQQSTNQQAVAVTFQRYVFPYNHPHAELILSNQTSHSVWFTGYGSASPAYSIQHLENDRWAEKQRFWCGTGLERWEFSAHQSIRLQVSVNPSMSNTTFRVGINCSPEKEYDKKTAVTCWSDKIAPQ